MSFRDYRENSEDIKGDCVGTDSITDWKNSDDKYGINQEIVKTGLTPYYNIRYYPNPFTDEFINVGLTVCNDNMDTKWLDVDYVDKLALNKDDKTTLKRHLGRIHSMFTYGDTSRLHEKLSVFTRSKTKYLKLDKITSIDDAEFIKLYNENVMYKFNKLWIHEETKDRDYTDKIDFIDTELLDYMENNADKFDYGFGGTCEPSVEKEANKIREARDKQKLMNSVGKDTSKEFKRKKLDTEIIRDHLKSMSNADIKEALIGAGIYDKDMNLTESYGGKSKECPLLKVNKGALCILYRSEKDGNYYGIGLIDNNKMHIDNSECHKRIPYGKREYYLLSLYHHNLTSIKYTFEIPEHLSKRFKIEYVSTPHIQEFIDNCKPYEPKR